MKLIEEYRTNLLMIFNNLFDLIQTFLRSFESELRQLICAVVQSLETSGTIDLKTWHSFSSDMVNGVLSNIHFTFQIM